ncbi:Endonuclease/exonuclease/phosphatase, partial [Corchorus olitorius]
RVFSEMVSPPLSPRSSASHSFSDLSGQEVDLLQRSNKRIKDNHSTMDTSDPLPSIRNFDRAPSNRSSKSCDPNSKETLPFNPQASYRDMLVQSQEGLQICFNTNSRQLDEESDNEKDFDDDIPTILLSSEEKKRIRTPWLNSIIVKTFGKSVGYNFLYPRVKAEWKPHGPMDCIDLGKDLFLFRFHSKDDFNRIFYGGPWFVGPYFLSMRLWEPSFYPEKAAFSTTAVWARLPGLPIEIFDSNTLRRIGNQLGVLLRVDANTASSSRGRYARICVQVDLDRPLLPRVRIGQHVKNILYESISGLCFKCGCIGHNINVCPSSVSVPQDKQSDNPNSMDVEKETQKSKKEAEFGPWMVVSRRKPPKPQGRAAEPGKAENSKSGLNAQNLGHNGHIDPAPKPSKSNAQSSIKGQIKSHVPSISRYHPLDGVTDNDPTPSSPTHLDNAAVNLKAKMKEKSSDLMELTENTSLPKNCQPQIPIEIMESSTSKTQIKKSTNHPQKNNSSKKALLASPEVDLEEYLHLLQDPKEHDPKTPPLSEEVKDQMLKTLVAQEFLEAKQNVFTEVEAPSDSPWVTTTLRRIIFNNEVAFHKTILVPKFVRETRVIAQSYNELGNHLTEHNIVILPHYHPEANMLWKTQEGQVSVIPELAQWWLGEVVPTPMDLKILVWNCRGAASSEFKQTFMDMIRIHRPSICILSETKVSGEVAERISGSLGFDNKHIINARGFSGGLWMLWDSLAVNLEILPHGDQAIHAIVK